MEPSCSGNVRLTPERTSDVPSGSNSENKTEDNTDSTVKPKVETTDTSEEEECQADEIERNDFEEENRMMNNCTGAMIVESDDLVTNDHFSENLACANINLASSTDQRPQTIRQPPPCIKRNPFEDSNTTIRNMIRPRRLNLDSVNESVKNVPSTSRGNLVSNVISTSPPSTSSLRLEDFNPRLRRCANNRPRATARDASEQCDLVNLSSGVSGVHLKNGTDGESSLQRTGMNASNLFSVNQETQSSVAKSSTVYENMTAEAILARAQQMSIAAMRASLPVEDPSEEEEIAEEHLCTCHSREGKRTNVCSETITHSPRWFSDERYLMGRKREAEERREAVEALFRRAFCIDKVEEQPSTFFGSSGQSNSDFTMTEEDEAEGQPIEESRLWARKRKLDIQPLSSPSPTKKLCPDVSLTSPSTCRTSPSVPAPSSVSSTQPPPPDFIQWMNRFQTWSNSERIYALDGLLTRCSANQVRHVMNAIEPMFQRDFISLLPKELALSVLGYLGAKDLLRAAQTCKYWQFLADDNLLWKEQCRRIGITSYKKIPRVLSGCASPWKAAYMRQYMIEDNWLHKSVDEPIVMRGHDDHVITCLQFHGNRILSGSDDTTLKVWSAVTGKCLRTLVGHSGGVWSSQMVGNLVISGSTDRTLRVWNAATGHCLKILSGHTSTVRCMHLYQDRVVSGSRDATLRVWSIPEGRCLKVLIGHLAAVRCVQSDGKVVVSGAYDYFVKVWNPDTGECLHTLAGHTNRVYSLQFDGIHVVSGSLDTSIRVWDVESGQLKHTLIGHQSLTSGMELHSNILVSGNADSTVKVWDITTGHCIHTLSGPNKHQSAVTCLQSSNRFVITSSDDGTVKLWDVRTGEFIRNLVHLGSGGSGGVVWRIRASATKLICAVGSRNGTEETKLLVLDFDVPGACRKCDE